MEWKQYRVNTNTRKVLTSSTLKLVGLVNKYELL